MRHYSLGNKEIDELLGGIDTGAVLLIEGLPGAGKTTLALSLAYNNIVENNSSVLYIVFGETPEKLLSFSEKIGLSKIRGFVESGKLKFIKIPIVSDVMLIDYITKIISEETGRYDIVIVDSVTPLVKVLQSYKTKRTWIQNIYDYISKMSHGLLVLVADIMSENDTDLRMLEYVSDIVLKINYEFKKYGYVERTIEVRKYRGKQIRTASIPFTIAENKGLIVLNYLGRDLVKYIRSRKKPIVLNCPPLQKLLNTKTIKPGTQILLVDRRGWFEGSALIDHLIHILYELRRQGYNIHITSFCPEILDVVKEKMNKFISTKGNVKGGVFIREIDPGVVPPQYIISEARPEELALNIDVFLTLGLERLFYIYGIEEVKNMTINIIQMLKRMGISTLRYMMLADDVRIPDYLIEFHDIVLEMTPRQRDEIVIRVLKNLRATNRIEVLDRELKQCL